MVGGADVVLLLVAGVLAGVAGSVAGLASLVSYPALLAVGLPALTANVTNTVALVSYTVSAASFSRTELAGQAGRLRRFALTTALGGAAFYLTNGTRDYAVVMSPMGGVRVHVWRGGAWTP